MSALKVNDKVIVSSYFHFTPLATKAGIVTAYNPVWDKPCRVYIPGYNNARGLNGEWYFEVRDLRKVNPSTSDDHLMREWERKMDVQKASDERVLTMPRKTGEANEQDSDLWSAAAKVLNSNDNLYLASDSFHSVLDSNCGLKMNVDIGWMIKDVIFNPPATIILWHDGNKTVVKCSDNDEFDKEKGFAMALSKYILGNRGSYYDIFKKFDAINENEEHDEPEYSLGDQLHDIVNNALKKAYVKYAHETESNVLDTMLESQKPKKKIFGVRLKKKDDTEKKANANKTYKDVAQQLNPKCVNEYSYGGVSGCPGNYIKGAPIMNNCFSPFCTVEQKNAMCSKCWNTQCDNKEE